MLGAAGWTPGPQGEGRVSTPVSCSVKERELPGLRRGGAQHPETRVRKSAWGGPGTAPQPPSPLLPERPFSGPSIPAVPVPRWHSQNRDHGAQASSESRARCGFSQEGAQSPDPSGSRQPRPSPRGLSRLSYRPLDCFTRGRNETSHTTCGFVRLGERQVGADRLEPALLCSCSCLCVLAKPPGQQRALRHQLLPEAPSTRGPCREQPGSEHTRPAPPAEAGLETSRT